MQRKLIKSVHLTQPYRRFVDFSVRPEMCFAPQTSRHKHFQCFTPQSCYKSDKRELEMQMGRAGAFHHE